MGNEFFELFTSSNLSEWHFKKFLGKLNLVKNDDWVPRGTWLITGGTRGIGLEVGFLFLCFKSSNLYQNKNLTSRITFTKTNV
ncbi:unnamed protein product [Meloidogyne enterolobii]|uniref:Uncharacterized protein n=1 Tax=Meloidogyne enterolobii TaxID=390850 RepID=A0ACB1ABI2_MELEN